MILELGIFLGQIERRPYQVSFPERTAVEKKVWKRSDVPGAISATAVLRR